MERFPVLNEIACSGKRAWRSIIVSPKNRKAIIGLERPFTICSRRDLDWFFLERLWKQERVLKKKRVKTVFTMERAGGFPQTKVFIGARFLLGQTVF